MAKLLIQRFHPFSIQSVYFVRFLCLNSEMFKPIFAPLNLYQTKLPEQLIHLK